jgi:uncharacterized protein YbcI
MAVTRTPRTSIESEAATAVALFHRDQHGHFPDDVRALLVDDMLIVRCTGTFSRQEQQIAGTSEGQKLIQSARRELHSDLRHDLHGLVEGIVGCRVVRSFYDIDVRTGDEAKVFVLDNGAGRHEGTPQVL